MTTLRQAAQQALEAMETNQYTVAELAPHKVVMKFNDAIAALCKALEQPEPEKVAWRFWVGDWQYVCDERMLHHLDKDVFFEPLYTMPPKQRKKNELSPMQEAAQMLRDRAAKQRKDNGND